MDERVFLTASHPESGLINYIEVYEADSGPTDLVQMNDNWRPLITGLAWPTHTHYDFTHKLLYVCDCDQILQYEINFQNTNGEDIIYSTLMGPVVQQTACGGLEIDKFHNLWFVDTVQSKINKVSYDLLILNKYPADVINTVYEGAVTHTA